MAEIITKSIAGLATEECMALGIVNISAGKEAILIWQKKPAINADSPLSMHAKWISIILTETIRTTINPILKYCALIVIGWIRKSKETLNMPSNLGLFCVCSIISLGNFAMTDKRLIP